MVKNKKILVAIPMTQEQRERLEQAAPEGEFTYTTIFSVTEEQVQQAEIILGNVPVSMIRCSERLEWLQLNSAGADAYLAEGVLSSHTILTTSQGAYGKAVSEHLFAMVLALQKKLHLYRDAQKEHRWADEGEVVSMADATVLILGAGDIGRHFAALAHGMGAYVIGVKRSLDRCPSCMDELHVMTELKELLPRADVVAAFVPSTRETKGIFDRELFYQMKRGSYFVNGGRGDLVCMDALCDVLEEGHLAGAALDVTVPEPLPKEHRLWGIPNAFVTPHVAGFYHLPETLRNVVRISTENVRRYAAGEPLQNVAR